MTLKDFSKQFEALSEKERIELLAVMMMALTVEARSATIDLPVDQAVHTYKGLNELQHLVANQLNAFLLPKGKVRPGQVFWGGIEGVASQFQLQKYLLSAVKWSFSVVGKPPAAR